MGLGGGMGMGGARMGWGLMRSLGRDPSVKDERLRRGTWKRVIQFARPYRKLLAVFLVLIVFDAVVSTANPLVYRAIINDVVKGIRHRPLVHTEEVAVIALAAVIAGLALVSVVNGVAERGVSARIGEGLIYDMRSKVFEHVNQMPIAFFTRAQTGALVSRLNNDVLGAQQAFTDVFSNVIGNIVSVTLVLGAMFALSWKITLASLVVLPLFIIPARLMSRRLQRITRESYNLNAEMTTMMSERFNVAGALLVKIFGRPNLETQSFNQRAGRVRDIGITQALFARILFASLALTAAIATALVYGWGGVLTLHGALTLGTIVALTAYLNRLYVPLTQLSNVQVDVLTAMVSFDRVFEVLDLPPMIQESPDAVPIPPGPAGVVFDHVDFAYPGAEEVSLASLESVAVLEHLPRVPVLHDVSFVIEPGELVALVGPTGAGKTTIGSLLARLYDVDSGSVKVNGVDVRQATIASLQAAVGVVTQDAHLFHDTIRANLIYARPEATDAEMWQALADAQIRELVESLPEQLDTVVGDRGYRLSGGEKQRVALARLLLKAPTIVVLDEATAHLDSESEAAVQRALDQALVGRTSLVIAHRLSTIRNADQILVLDDGRIVERGTHEELIEKAGLYRELYQTQFADPTVHA
ncbi:MAG: ABC transporter ATP-binding protein [Acidimicrobiales bacterium]